MATLVQAVRMALHYGETHLGVTDIKRPASPQNVWKAIQEAKGGGGQ